MAFAFAATHLPNAFDLFAFVPYFALNASRPAACSVLQDFAALIVAALIGVVWFARRSLRKRERMNARGEVLAT